MSYRVLVDDNAHDQDEASRYELGTFATLDHALTVAKKVVDDYLVSACKPGMRADERYRSYTTFGADPFIVAPSGAKTDFSAWLYAKERCAEMARRR